MTKIYVSETTTIFKTKTRRTCNVEKDYLNKCE